MDAFLDDIFSRALDNSELDAHLNSAQNLSVKIKGGNLKSINLCIDQKSNDDLQSNKQWKTEEPDEQCNTIFNNMSNDLHKRIKGGSQINSVPFFLNPLDNKLDSVNILQSNFHYQENYHNRSDSQFDNMSQWQHFYTGFYADSKTSQMTLESCQHEANIITNLAPNSIDNAALSPSLHPTKQSKLSISDIQARAKTIRIGKVRWPPPLRESEAFENEIQRKLELQRKIHEEILTVSDEKLDQFKKEELKIPPDAPPLAENFVSKLMANNQKSIDVILDQRKQIIREKLEERVASSKSLKQQNSSVQINEAIKKVTHLSKQMSLKLMNKTNESLDFNENEKSNRSTSTKNTNNDIDDDSIESSINKSVKLNTNIIEQDQESLANFVEVPKASKVISLNKSTSINSGDAVYTSKIYGKKL